MSRSIDKIKSPINSELKEFEIFFQNAITSKTTLLDKVLHYVIRRKGKAMRPIMIFLAAGVTGEITRKTFDAAFSIELLHTASLLHDDVVDNSNQRRGFPSVNAIWKNRVSILTGDYMLAKGMIWCIDREHYDILKEISVAVKDLSKGELLQMENTRKGDYSREIYFDIIKKKTASLLAASAAVGVRSTSNDQEAIEKLREIGLALGLAFQIKDDIIDLTNSLVIGKPAYQDIKEGKITLPLICAIENANKEEIDPILRIIKKKRKSSRNILAVVNFIKNNRGVESADLEIDKYIEKAHSIIDSFNDSKYKSGIKEYIDFVAKRSY